MTDHTTADELTAEEARALADDLGLKLYRAEDALAFVGECCDIADREQRPITTADVREWLKGARCGRQLLAEAVDRAARRARIAAAIRAAACTGDCGKSEEECARERIQPFVWHHGVLAVVEGTPEQMADAVLAGLTEPSSAATWLDAAAECNKAGGIYAERGANDAAGAAFALMEKFLVEAGKAEYVATPCSAPDYCEDGGEPCSVHERLMGHAEGDHELCAPDCGEPWLRRMADETQPAEAHEPVHQWRVEILDGDEWMPASGLRRDRSQAADQLRMSGEKRPLWSDGTPVQRRLVRETTTYTVEAEHTPAAGARQDGAES
jgi:hypothetical protein